MSVQFSAIKYIYNMKPPLFLKLFHPLNRNFVPIKQSLPTFSSPNSQLWSVSVNLLILDLICRWNHTIFALCVFVISFNMLSGFIHTIAYIKLHSCLWLHSIPLYVNIHMLFINQLMDTGVISVCFFFQLFWLMLLWILIYRYLSPYFRFFWVHTPELNCWIKWHCLPVSETRRPFFFLLWNFAAAGRLSLVALSGAAL